MGKIQHLLLIKKVKYLQPVALKWPRTIAEETVLAIKVLVSRRNERIKIVIHVEMPRKMPTDSSNSHPISYFDESRNSANHDSIFRWFSQNYLIAANQLFDFIGCS